PASAIVGTSVRRRSCRRVARCRSRSFNRFFSTEMRRRARRRSVSSCDSPGPRVPTPPPSRSACCAKMSRISCVRSTTRVSSAFSRNRCCAGSSSSSTSRLSAPAARYRSFSSSSFPLPTYVRCAGRARCCTTEPTGSTPAVRASSRTSASSFSGSAPWPSTARTNPRSGSVPAKRGIIDSIMPAAAPGNALAERALALVDIPSVSRSEAEVTAYVRQAVRLPGVLDDGESLLFATRTGKPLVLLAGHTDTVPAQGNLPGALADGAVVGLGASDMKGGLAVMIELANWAASAHLAYDLGVLFFPREELGPAENPLPGVFAAAPVVDEAALVVCLEPTDNTLQLGCVGNLTARVVFEGRAAHSARPWLGVNAVAVAFDGLRDVLALEPRDVELEGLVFREVLSVTEIHGGIA